MFWSVKIIRTNRIRTDRVSYKSRDTCSKNMVINWHMKTRKLFTTTGCSCCPPACFFSSPELMDSFFQQLSVVDKQFSTDAETCSLQQQSTILSNTEKSWGAGTCSFPLILFTRWEKRTTGCSKSYFSDIIGGQKRKSKKFLSRIVASTFSAFSANFHRRKTLLGFVSKNKIFPIWEIDH